MSPAPTHVSNQIAWAKGRAAQHRRLAQRHRPGTPAHTQAVRHEQIAEAVARSLEQLKAAR